MTYKTQSSMEQHINLLGWLNIGLNVFMLVMAVFIYMFMMGIGVATGDLEALGIMSVVGGFTGLILVATSIPGIIAGVGLLKQKPWARILAMIVAALGIMNFPYGTAMAVYTFWVLTQPEVNLSFATAKSA